MPKKILSFDRGTTAVIRVVQKMNQYVPKCTQHTCRIENVAKRWLEATLYRRPRTIIRRNQKPLWDHDIVALDAKFFSFLSKVNREESVVSFLIF